MLQGDKHVLLAEIIYFYCQLKRNVLTGIVYMRLFLRVLIADVSICVMGSPTPTLWIVLIIIIIISSFGQVLVMTAIAVDRFTSLVQPLRYNNMITHSSVERYIASFWIYSCIIGTTPIIYIQCYVVREGFQDPHCSFSNIIDKTLQTFLFFTVYGPCAVILMSKCKRGLNGAINFTSLFLVRSIGLKLGLLLILETLIPKGFKVALLYRELEVK